MNTSVTDTLSAGKHFVMVDLGGGEEALDSLCEPLHYIIDGDIVCLPDDSLVRAAYEDLAKADVLSFSPVRQRGK